MPNTRLILNVVLKSDMFNYFLIYGSTITQNCGYLTSDLAEITYNLLCMPLVNINLLDSFALYTSRPHLDMSTFCHFPKSKLERTIICFFPLPARKSAIFFANSIIIPYSSDHILVQFLLTDSRITYVNSTMEANIKHLAWN